jgi:CheY-like chemotaxis protein
MAFHILLLDDDPQEREKYKDKLSRELPDIILETAGSLQEARNRLEGANTQRDTSDQIDLIILDLVIQSAETGEAFFTELQDSYPKIKVVIFTCLTTEIEEGRNHYLHITRDLRDGFKTYEYLFKGRNDDQDLIAVIKKAIHAESTIQAEMEECRLSLVNDGKVPEDWIRLQQKLSSLSFLIEDTGKHKKEYYRLKNEIDDAFTGYLKKNYRKWIQDGSCRPLMSCNFIERTFYHLPENKKIFFLVMDCLRYDLWFMLKKDLLNIFSGLEIMEEGGLFSTLPTSTPFARNSLFANKLPKEIEKKHWFNGQSNEYHNYDEKMLFQSALQNSEENIEYIKINDQNEIDEDFFRFLKGKSRIKAVVYNEIDQLVHQLSDGKIRDDITSRTSIFSALGKNAFRRMLRIMFDQGAIIIITTDHGYRYADEWFKLADPYNRIDKYDLQDYVGKRGRTAAVNSVTENETSTLFVISDQEDHGVQIPAHYHLLATGNRFLVREIPQGPKARTSIFSHGGVSLDEMVIPYAVLARNINF